MRFRIGDKVRVLDGENISEYTQGWNMPEFIGDIVTISDCEQYSDGRVAYRVKENYYTFDERGLESVDADGGKIVYAPNGASLFWMPEPEKPISIEEQLGLPKGVSIHDLKPVEWYKPMEIRIDVSDFEAKELERRLGDYYKRLKRSSGSDIINRHKTMNDWIDTLTNGWAKLGCTTFRLSPSEVDELIKKAEEKKMPTKFTFYTVEGYRIDKSNNTKIPTVTTEVLYKDKDGCATGGSATCDKADYDERQGVIEALANMCCDGNFDREYNKAIKWNKKQDLRNRTCRYCGQVFDTYQERIKHMDWHVERKKARRERYLLRKRAKEIAFEEAAKKMAEEMIEDKK